MTIPNYRKRKKKDGEDDEYMSHKIRNWLVQETPTYTRIWGNLQGIGKVVEGKFTVQKEKGGQQSVTKMDLSGSQGLDVLSPREFIVMITGNYRGERWRLGGSPFFKLFLHFIPETEPLKGLKPVFLS